MALTGRGFEEAQESNVHFDFLGQGQLWWGWAGVPSGYRDVGKAAGGTVSTASRWS